MLFFSMSLWHWQLRLEHTALDLTPFRLPVLRTAHVVSRSRLALRVHQLMRVCRRTVRVGGSGGDRTCWQIYLTDDFPSTTVGKSVP